ncbi:MAG: hypothetical protein JWR32_2396 [Mycobacterium sp.]|jgi:hypothetical protein|nr:hypothetical protein [Mycobacterium sp.]
MVVNQIAIAAHRPPPKSAFTSSGHPNGSLVDKVEFDASATCTSQAKSGPLGPVPCDSQDLDAVTMKFRRSRGGPVVTVLMADAGQDDISQAYPWRTFRWYKGQRHNSGWYWSETQMSSVIYESRLGMCRLVYADFDLSVRRMVAQPFELTCAVKAAVRLHVPDYLLITDAGPLVVDTPRSATRRQLSTLLPAPIHDRLSLSAAPMSRASGRRWRLHTAGARWAGRPGSLRPSGWLASRPGQALRPGRCRGIAACPGRRPPGR